MSDGDLHDTINLVFHSIYFLFLLTFIIFIIAATASYLRNANAPIPEVLVQDIVAEQLKTCLAPVNEQFNVPEIGYIDANKLNRFELEKCVPEDTNDFIGVLITDSVSGELTRITYTDGGYEAKSAPYTITIKDSENSYRAATMEVLFR